MNIRNLMIVNFVLITALIVGVINLKVTPQSGHCFSKSYPGISNISGCTYLKKGDIK